MTKKLPRQTMVNATQTGHNTTTVLWRQYKTVVARSIVAPFAESTGVLQPNNIYTHNMPAQRRQTSYDSYTGSIYSQSENGHRNPTIGDAEDPPATASDKHPGVSERISEKAQPPSGNNADMTPSLAEMLIGIREDLMDKLLNAFDEALSVESLAGKQLKETEENLQHLIDRKKHYKKKSGELENKTAELEKEKENLREQSNALKAEAGNWKAEKDALIVKAKELFA